jgi:hypothetical protein
MDVWIEYAKQHGPWAVMLCVVGYALWRASRWFASKVAEPLVGVVVAAVPTVAGAAVKMRDDVAEIKESTIRIEAQQGHCCMARISVQPGKAGTAPA